MAEKYFFPVNMLCEQKQVDKFGEKLYHIMVKSYMDREGGAVLLEIKSNDAENACKCVVGG